MLLFQKLVHGNGTVMVKEGDVVKKGDVLIAGKMEGKYTGIRYVHANGDVYANVWYSDKAEVQLKQTKQERTENVEKKYSIKINNFKINFYKKLSNFEKCDTIEEEKKLKIFSNFYLPFSIIEYTNYEMRDTQIEYSLQEAKELAIKQAEDKVKSQIEDKEKILDTHVTVTQKEGKVEAEVICEVLEDIGTKEKFEIWKDW